MIKKSKMIECPSCNGKSIVCDDCHGTGRVAMSKLKGKTFTVDFSDLLKTLTELETKRNEITIADKIKEYLEIPDIGQTILDGCELILRLRLGQYDTASGVLMKYIKTKQKDKNIFKNKYLEYALSHLSEVIKLGTVNTYENLYKTIELGEYIKCYQTNRMCKDVRDCWITRKGFSPCRNKFKTKGGENNK